MALTRINEFVAVEGCEEQLTNLLTQVAEYLRCQEGCQGAELLVSDEDETRLLVIERWTTKEAHHQALVNYPKEKMSSAREWIARPPRGEFFIEPGSFHPEVH